MKTRVLFLLVVLLSNSLLAPAQDTTLYKFCEIHIYKKPNGKVTIALDNGTKTYSPLGDNFIKDQTGERWNSIVQWIVLITCQHWVGNMLRHVLSMGQVSWYH